MTIDWNRLEDIFNKFILCLSIHSNQSIFYAEVTFSKILADYADHQIIDQQMSRELDFDDNLESILKSF